MNLSYLMYGLISSVIIGGLAFYKQSLSWDGYLAAIIMGSLIYAYGGGYAYAVLMVFFGSSIFIGRLDKDAPKETRTSIQVLANSILATLMAVLYGSTGELIFLAMFVASVGVSAADTWASELGKRSTSRPFHIFKFKRVDKGLSGAVSIRGIIASLAAGLTFAFLASFRIESFILVFLVGAFSFLGSIIDSMLGTIQVKYIHKISNIITEEKSHLTEYYSGIKYLGNNGVNFLSNMVSLLIMSTVI